MIVHNRRPRMRRAGILALALVGCAGGVPVEVVARSEAVCARAEIAVDAAVSIYAEHGVDLFFVGCGVDAEVPETAVVTVPAPYSANIPYADDGRILLHVVQTVVDTDSHEYGGFTIGEPCGGAMAVVESQLDDAATVMHEIGHYLQLSHVEERGNVMYPRIDYVGTELTPEQFRRAAQTVEYLEGCTR